MHIHRIRSSALISAFTLLATGGCGGSGGGSGQITSLGAFTQNNLTADNAAGKAANTDVHLVNPWGMAYLPGGPFWVSDNKTGLSTVYDGTGANQGIVVTIPTATGGSNGPVTGCIANTTSDFPIGNTGPAQFIFDSEDGVISAWNSGSSATTVANRSANNADYTGLAMGSYLGTNYLFATDFFNAEIDIFDNHFNYVKSVTDSNLPAGYAPFGIANIGGTLFVTFAEQDSTKHRSVAGAGLGFVDEFSTLGTVVKRFEAGAPLNAPWGIALAPANGFGNSGGELLIANLGDGKINAFDPNSQNFLGPLEDSTNTPIAIPGLWAISFGGGAGASGSSSVLYFTAGPNQYADGLFGSITGTATPRQRGK